VNLTELLASARAADGDASMTVGDEWMQGRSLFGGLQAAIGWLAMRTLVPEPMPLRTLQMTFIEPVPSGRVAATARVLRAGKNTLHVEARLENSAGLQASMLAVFGSGRASVVRRDLPAPAPPGPRRRMPFVAGMTPSFMQQFDVDLVGGALPFSNTHVHNVAFQLGLHDAGPATEAHVLVIADFVPPVALSWMPKPVPGSSLTWMLELLDADFAAQPLRDWRLESEMLAARDGYTSQSTTLWTPDGTPVALSRQSMVVFG